MKGERQALPSRGDNMITALQLVLCSYFITKFQLKHSYRMGVVKIEGLNTLLLLTYGLREEIILVGEIVNYY